MRRVHRCCSALILLACCSLRRCSVSRMFFLSSQICKVCPSKSDRYLNDLTTFLVSTVTALCDSDLSEAKLAKSLDSLQHVIRTGLRASYCVSFQSAAALVALRYSLKLPLNRDLVLDWLRTLCKHTRAGSEWESLCITMQLMRSQQIVLLPPRLASRHADLMSRLSPSERCLMEEEEAKLLRNGVDLNEAIATDAATRDQGASADIVSHLNALLVVLVDYVGTVGSVICTVRMVMSPHQFSNVLFVPADNRCGHSVCIESIDCHPIFKTRQTYSNSRYVRYSGCGHACSHACRAL